MFDFIPQEYEKLVNIIFLVITALIAHHALTYRNDEGKKDLVRIFFGCIAAVYFFLVLVKHVLGINLLSDKPTIEMVKDLGAEKYTIQTKATVLGWVCMYATGGIINSTKTTVFKRSE